MKRILCIGPEWRGSNANGLFKALSRVGNAISVIDEFYYLNLRGKSFLSKTISKFSRNLQITDFNKAIIEEANYFTPDLVLVYKGAFVKPETIISLKKSFGQVVNFYPDVSFRTHGSLLAQTLPLYDKVFTTKTFGIKDMEKQLGQKNGFFIPHGFDPDIHKPLSLNNPDLKNIFECDASFIGTWSPHKEKTLSTIKHILPDLNLKIWGAQWGKSKSQNLLKSIQNKSVTGDLYSLAINASKLNLAILSEKVTGASSGDKITSRTFHIPAAKGCMLHQASEEIDTYFENGKEMLTFESAEDLAQKINQLLNDENFRQSITNAGH
ncbi:MAG: glycosyltransferase, partial [Cytophagales bacterium]